MIPSGSIVKQKTVYSQSQNHAPNYESRGMYESEGNESDTSFSNTSQFGGNGMNLFDFRS